MRNLRKIAATRRAVQRLALHQHVVHRLKDVALAKSSDQRLIEMVEYWRREANTINAATIFVLACGYFGLLTWWIVEVFMYADWRLYEEPANIELTYIEINSRT